MGKATLRVGIVSLCLLLAAPAQAELVGYWPFDGDVSDQSGNGLDGTNLLNVSYNGSTPFGTGSALVLGGSTRVDVGPAPSLNSQAFTLAYWVNQNGAVQNGNFERITSRGSDTFETALSGDGSLSYYPSQAGWANTGHDVPRNGWQHVAFATDGATMRVYVNGTERFAGQSNAMPTGILRIGARASVWTEGGEGKVDDVALWNSPLSPSAVASLGSQGLRPTDITTTTVTSDPTAWLLSTVRTSGGPLGTWTPTGDPLPDASTFTQAAAPSGAGGIVGAANDLGLGTLLGDGGNGTPTGIQYYRTTFDLPAFAQASANLALATDNGAQVFINGVEVARETSFLVENWQRPYSTLSIGSDGAVGNVTLFDLVAPSFSDWRAGENEIIVALRNPDPEALSAGGLAFRLDVDTSLAPPQIVVTSDPSRWSLSTERTSGGPLGTWSPSGAPPPDASTFTLAASPSPVAGIVNAAADIGVDTLLGDGGAGAPTGVQYYRTTFDLAPFSSVAADLVLAVDNGAQVFINGVEIARETSFLVENWASPYSSLRINDDGSITDVTLFDTVASSFTGWLEGENEIIIALRNPDPEALAGGGIAFRMTLTATPDVIPEPATLSLLALGGLAALVRRRRSAR